MHLLSLCNLLHENKYVGGGQTNDLSCIDAAKNSIDLVKETNSLCNLFVALA